MQWHIPHGKILWSHVFALNVCGKLHSRVLRSCSSHIDDDAAADDDDFVRASKILGTLWQIK